MSESACLSDQPASPQGLASFPQPPSEPLSKPAGTVVLSGGPCGLYAALTLARAGHKVTLIEKEPVLGGLARGHQRGANFYDLGVHMLHAFDPEVFETIKEIMGDERIERYWSVPLKTDGIYAKIIPCCGRCGAGTNGRPFMPTPLKPAPPTSGSPRKRPPTATAAPRFSTAS